MGKGTEREGKERKQTERERIIVGYQGVSGAFSEAAVRMYFGEGIPETNAGIHPESPEKRRQTGSKDNDTASASDRAPSASKDTEPASANTKAASANENAVPETFADRAASAYEVRGYSDFISIFRDVESGELDYAMLPVENTTTGIIARTYDHFQHYNVHAVGEVVVPIKECLIANPGTRLEDVREVYSHPEALSQCHSLFVKYPWMTPHAHEDTALSVSYIRDSGDRSKAALASELAASTYGMEILLPQVQDNDVNMTRFLCVTNREEYPEDADKVSIRMVTAHTPGSLFNALGIFASLGINVLKLESRPIFGRVFEYCFYLDFAGNLRDPDVAEALRRLEYDCAELKVFGNYKAAMEYM